jgi:hypothetical protein
MRVRSPVSSSTGPHGKTDIDTAAQAAEALRPIADTEPLRRCFSALE